MTKPRTIPKTRFHVFIVEPEPGFQPSNWQNTPAQYRIVDYVGAFPFKGSADAEKFLHNHRVLQTSSVERWAICLDLSKPMLQRDDLTKVGGGSDWCQSRL